MQYDFDTVIDRRYSNSIKWEVQENELPMWVADMDFMVAPPIREALQKRVEHGVFGYTTVPGAWRSAISGWWERRHGFHMEYDWLLFSTGVVPILSSAIRKLTTVGENVLVQTPCYNHFFYSIQNNGRNVLENRLLYDGSSYEIDWLDLEKKLADPQTTLMIFCNPQNPTGTIWTRSELERVGALCAANHVRIISDEIHCDLTDPGYEYTPFASVSEACAQNSITCIAPTKTFNIAGLQTAIAVVPGADLRHKLENALKTDEVSEPNAFAIDGAIAAFTKGEDWLEGLRNYVAQNREFAQQYIQERLPMISLIPSHATYLLWIDCSGIVKDRMDLSGYLRKETGLYVCAGEVYGDCGKHFLRVNIACSRSTLEDGLARLERGILAYKENGGGSE